MTSAAACISDGGTRQYIGIEFVNSVQPVIVGVTVRINVRLSLREHACYFAALRSNLESAAYVRGAIRNAMLMGREFIDRKIKRKENYAIKTQSPLYPTYYGKFYIITQANKNRLNRLFIPNSNHMLRSTI